MVKRILLSKPCSLFTCDARLGTMVVVVDSLELTYRMLNVRCSLWVFPSLEVMFVRCKVRRFDNIHDGIG